MRTPLLALPLVLSLTGCDSPRPSKARPGPSVPAQKRHRRHPRGLDARAAVPAREGGITALPDRSAELDIARRRAAGARDEACIYPRQRRNADFTDITNPKNPEEQLYLSDVFHNAFVRLDEKGTEAAAATVTEASEAFAPTTTEPPNEFKTDRPFLFFLRDRQSGMILFMGRVVNPSAQ